MKGASDVATELSPEISPTIQLEGPTAEWDFLKSTRLCATGVSVNGNVGFVSLFRAINPAGSAVIATVTAMIVSVGGATQVRMLLGRETVGLTAGENNVRDSRWRPLSVLLQTAVTVGFSNTAASGGDDTLLHALLASNAPFTYSVPFLLLPGDSVDVFTVNQNVQMQVSLAWRERQLPRLEE